MLRLTLPFAVVALLLSPSSQATAPVSAPLPDLQKLCDQDAYKPTCLQALIALRCQQYSFPLFPLAEACARTGSALVSKLDLKSHTIQLEEADGKLHTSTLTVIFVKRLNALIADPQAQAYLHDLMVDLRRASRNQDPFSLWPYTVEKARYDETLALEWISVLLQDTSRTKIQIFYLQDRAKNEKLSAPELQAISELQVIQELIRAERFRSDEGPRWLRLYPEATAELKASPYHFYPMAWMARLLLNEGVHPGLSAFVPFLFNTDYEFQTLDPKAWPLRIPGPFKVAPHLEGKMSDIYAGLTGSLWGIDRLQKAEDLNTFTAAFAKNPKRTMQSYFLKLMLP